MTDRTLGLPKPVPPSPEETSTRKLALDVGGFAETPPSAPPAEESQDAPGVKTPDVAETKRETARPRTRKSRTKPKIAAKEQAGDEVRRKRNALLPHRLVPDLRDRAHDDGVPHGEVVIDAFVNHIDAVRVEMTADRGDAERRKKLGLPARRRRQPRVGEDEVERRVQVGLYMSQQAISVIEEASDEFGISWSFLVSLLLDRELAADS